CALWYSNLWVF
nr:immunoglobulin light chain junction region [Mus musculus]NSM03181.1 immunoglobulin light chain junction region [Mus musculus]NSM03234.1 immunoglobulin light chain junction region [Mus musculus]NSM03237.1 immunoglobulin light chain junction region [Mus musculus]NSM03274.1 immunoglobulin light chain junction region [Mus musculus]